MFLSDADTHMERETVETNGENQEKQKQNYKIKIKAIRKQAARAGPHRRHCEGRSRFNFLNNFNYFCY